MAEPTAYDALVAELLADVLKLHDEVKGLKDFLPAQVDAAEQRLGGLIALLGQAGDAYREAISSYTQSQGDIVQARIEKESQYARERLVQDYNDVANATLERVEKSVKSTLQAAIAKAKPSGDGSGQALNLWQTLTLCIVSALLSGLLVAMGTEITRDIIFEANADLGQAVAAAWPKLDKKARAAIEAERKL